MELRMYGLVNYQLTGIQKGIQFLHSVVEYSNVYGEDVIYKEWSNFYKTVILLNGGTTNNKLDNNGIPFGTLNKYKKELDEIGIKNASFHEEDLGDQLTCISFIVDERVFNKKDYPDFSEFIRMNYFSLLDGDYSFEEAARRIKESDYPQDKKVYKKWLSIIGGERNEKLREFLKNFRLA
jgi:hypothetical protein